MHIYKHITQPDLSSIKRTLDPRFKNLKWMDIPFEDLYVTQSQWETFDIDHVKDILTDFHPAVLRASSVALIDGKYYLWEGMHSATASYLKGMDNIHCGVYECDSMYFKDIPSVEKFGQSQIADLVYMFMKETGAKTVEDVLKLIKVPDYEA